MRVYGLETQQPKAQPAAVNPAGSEKTAEVVAPVNKPAAKKQPKKGK